LNENLKVGRCHRDRGAGGSSSFRVSGKDNSAVSFGSEAARSDLEQAAAAVHGYLVARVKEEWPKACSYLSRSTKIWIEGAAVRKHLAGKGCAAHLDALDVPLTGGNDIESSEVEAGSLRTEDGRGFLFYRASAAPFRMRMEEEGGTWKVANAEQNALTCGYCDRSYNRIP
jgi:hypothetical protein